MTFDATRAYQADLDVRDWHQWRERLRGEPEGVLWALVGPRRSGKTWALKALVSNEAIYVNLQMDPNGLEKQHGRQCLLVDEPGRILQREQIAFIERCVEQKRAGGRLLIAMTPGEWELLAELDPEQRYVKARDRLILPLLTADQPARMARTRWASRLVGRIPHDWKTNPFLLELLFETAEKEPQLRKNIGELVLSTIRSTAQGRFRYVESVFQEGLSDSQRTAVRRIARAEQVIPEHELLDECGLTKSGPQIADPVLHHHFRPPLIIHHISDVHFGPKSAIGVDQKEQGVHGKRLAHAVAGATVADDYVTYIKEHKTGGPNVVLVSGDLVETGTSEQYEAARTFLGSLSSQLAEHPDLREGEPRIAIVGGNHDVDWGETRGSAGARKRHLAFAREMNGYPRPYLEIPPETRSLSTVVWPGIGVEVALLGSAEWGGEDDDIQAELVRMVDDITKRARKAFEEGEIDRFENLGRYLSRLDPGLVDYRDLKRLELHNWTQPLRIVMLHHPVSPMPTATEITRFGGLINAGATKTSMLRSRVCLVLHGHQHTGWFSCEYWPGRYDNRVLHIAAAPTLGSRETIENLGFNEIRIFREGSSYYEVAVHRIAYNGNGWDATPDVMTFNISA